MSSLVPCSIVLLVNRWRHCFNSAIHEVVGSLPAIPCRMVKNVASRNNPRTLFPYSRLHRFSGIVPVKSWNGRESGGFVNSAVRPTNSNFNKRGLCTLFFPPKIASITISCNVIVLIWVDFACLLFHVTINYPQKDNRMRLFMFK